MSPGVTSLTYILPHFSVYSFITFLLQNGYNKYSMTIHYEKKKTYVQVIKIKYILISTIGWSSMAH